MNPFIIFILVFIGFNLFLAGLGFLMWHYVEIPLLVDISKSLAIITDCVLDNWQTEQDRRNFSYLDEPFDNTEVDDGK